MLSIRRLAVVVALLFGVFVSNAIAQAMFPQPFTADMSMKTKNGQDMTGKFYVGEHKMRMDMDAHGHQVSMITDPGAKTSYMVMHQQKMYMEMNTASGMRGPGPKMPDIKSYDPANPCSAREGYTCKKVGTETVNGRTADKWEFTENSGKGKETVWIDRPSSFYFTCERRHGIRLDPNTRNTHFLALHQCCAGSAEWV